MTPLQYKAANRSKQMTLAQARKNVNKETFGTPAWEAAMQIVRELVEVENSKRSPFVHTSIDGDIFDQVR